MISPDAAGAGPQVRCFRLAGMTPAGSKKWTPISEAEYDCTADEKFLHPPAAGELVVSHDEANGKRHRKQPDDAIRAKVTTPERPNYEVKEDFYPARQYPERPSEGKRASPPRPTMLLTLLPTMSLTLRQ